MTLRRVLVGMTLVFGVSVWSWAGSDSPPPATAAAPAVEAHGDGTRDDAAHRYRTNQANHWRHVMVGTH